MYCTKISTKQYINFMLPSNCDQKCVAQQNRPIGHTAAHGEVNAKVACTCDKSDTNKQFLNRQHVIRNEPTQPGSPTATGSQLQAQQSQLRVKSRDTSVGQTKKGKCCRFIGGSGLHGLTWATMIGFPGACGCLAPSK